MFGVAVAGAVLGWLCEEYGEIGLERCRALRPVPGSLQTVQRAGFWGVNLALQASWSGHLGVENLNVVRSIA